jgi:hypothetical protein
LSSSSARSNGFARFTSSRKFAQIRAALGQPFTRMTIILGVVAALTFCSALLFQSQALKRIYRLDRRASGG